MVEPGGIPPVVFISYSHEDASWAQRLSVLLRPLQRQELIKIWTDREIRAGSDWGRDIENAIRESDIAVLLISANFLASDYIMEHELPRLRDRQSSGELRLLPLLVEESLWTSEPSLATMQFLSDPRKPLSTLSGAERDRELASIASSIIDLAVAIKRQKVNLLTKEPDRLYPSKGGRADANVDREFFISHSRTDGDFAELLKLKLQEKGLGAWIDTDRLGPGVDWQQEVDDAIRRSAVVIAIMSEDARRSEYVTYEWAFAWGAGIRIVPLMLRETQLHPRLATLQFLDFTNRIARPWDRLFAALVK